MKKWMAIFIALICISVLLVKTKPAFETDHVSHITFYGYSGCGIGSDVPEEHMTDIVNWLDSFRYGRMAFGLLPPGTNTVYVEIEYSDGTVIKHGLDTAEIGGFRFYMNSDEAPDCYWEILSKTSLGEQSIPIR